MSSVKQVIINPLCVCLRVCVNASCVLFRRYGGGKTAVADNYLGPLGVVSVYMFLSVWPEW